MFKRLLIVIYCIILAGLFTPLMILGMVLFIPEYILNGSTYLCWKISSFAPDELARLTNPDRMY